MTCLTRSGIAANAGNLAPVVNAIRLVDERTFEISVLDCSYRVLVEPNPPTASVTVTAGDRQIAVVSIPTALDPTPAHHHAVFEASLGIIGRDLLVRVRSELPVSTTLRIARERLRTSSPEVTTLSNEVRRVVYKDPASPHDPPIGTAEIAGPVAVVNVRLPDGTIVKFDGEDARPLVTGYTTE